MSYGAPDDRNIVCLHCLEARQTNRRAVMPIRWSINRGFTIAPNETQYWWWEWFDDTPNRAR